MTGYLYKAIEAIRLGILKNDMPQIIEGFELLTGQKVTGEHLGEPEETEAIATPPAPPAPPAPSAAQAEDFIAGTRDVKQPSRSVVSQDRDNKFVDDGSMSAEEEPGYEAVNDSVAPVARNRKKFEKVEQRCHSCGKVEMVNPRHRRDYYKCDKCITRR